MAYIVPRVLIKQEFTQVPVFADQPLAALVFGPQYDLYRYSVADEKTSTKVTHPTTPELGNAYQEATDVVYDFPNQTVGTDVDADYVKVFFEKAEAEYYPNALAATAGDVSRVAIPNTANYYPNRVVADNLIFKTANTYDRSTDFSERDVKAGDVVVLHSDTDNADFTTKVKALHAVKSAASTGAVTYDTDNLASQSEDFNNAVVAGAGNNDAGVTVANDSTAYKGGWLANGTYVHDETFTATVITGGNLSAVRFDISSTNGLAGSEDRTNVALAASPAPLTDADELSLYYDSVTGSSVKLDFTGSTNFVVGNTYSVTVEAPVVKTYVPTAAGTYTGPVDTTYKLTVVRGGKFYDGSTNAATCARVAITSSGTDSSATVSPQATVAFAVGSYGITATFAATSAVIGGLVAGDEYFIPVTAAADAQVKTLEVYDTLPTTLLDNTTTDWEISSLRLVKDYEVSQAIPDNDVDLNWEVIDNTISINSGITTTDPGMVDINSETINLNVKKANIFVEHRDLVKDNAVSIGSINDSSLVDETLGTVHPDNPLAQGVYDALLNSAGVTVYFCGVNSNDLEGYETVLGLAKKSEAYYGLVPLTFDRTIQDAVVAHVNAMSTPEVAKWRCTWLSSEIVPTALVYDVKDDGSDWLGTLTDDPLTANAPTPIYTLLTVAGATFVTDGVRPGDRVFINFRTDVFGDIVYDELVVDEVRTETTLVTTTGPTAAINVALKVQIQRVYTKDEQIDNLASIGSDYNNRRVRAVFPDKAKQGSTEKAGYFAAAAMAGLRSGVVPHQGLTNTEILGFSDVSASLSTFTEDQLNRLAEAGYWILTQDVVGATPYVRHQLTTDSENLNASEDSVTTNVDSISYGLRRALAPYIGKYNVNTTTLVAIKEAITSELNFRTTSTFTESAGNQLNGYKVVSLAQDPTFKDRINATITLDLPYPLNFITITLVV